MRLLGQGILSSRGDGGGERGVKAACALAHMRPWESSGWSILGGLITKRGGAKEAKMASRLLEKAVSLGGGAESACLLSEACLLSGDADRAMAEAGDSASQRGRCLMAMGKAKEAVVEFKRAMAGGKAGCVVEWLGSAYAATGDAAAAVACFERACEEAQASGDCKCYDAPSRVSQRQRYTLPGACIGSRCLSLLDDSQGNGCLSVSLGAQSCTPPWALWMSRLALSPSTRIPGLPGTHSQEN